ncbi:LAMI_0B07052g1_1 [Lachancea mirantina]|uniref:LAMI_0B07052g1_1 n=1 Tax=Lachancea mirantina TaxID=1230905 RepID=A0A1G4IWX6_9SACH|nr:LAMI_0B07052g1_1 [Lachancea mirantina]
METMGSKDKNSIVNANEVKPSTTSVSALPVEIVNLILEQLEKDNRGEITDIYNWLLALGDSNPGASRRIREQVAIWKLGKSESQILNILEIENGTNCLEQGVTDVPLRCSQLAVFIDNEWLNSDVVEEMLIVPPNIKVNLIYMCSPHRKSLQWLHGRLNAKIKNWPCLSVLVQEFPINAVYAPAEFELLTHRYFEQQLFENLVFFNVEKLVLQEDSLRNFLETCGSEKGSGNKFVSSTQMSANLRSYLNMRISLPHLIKLEFQDKNKKESLNYIDLNSIVRTKIGTNAFTLTDYFKVHSFSTWHMPSILRFSGHQFIYDQQETGIPEWRALIIKSGNGALSHMNVSLFPKGVKESKMIGWLPIDELLEKGRNSYSPLICLRSPSIETLHLGLSMWKKAGNIKLSGLYLPNLKRLTVSGSGAWPDYQAKSGIDELFLVTFSSWNDLSKCNSLKCCRLMRTSTVLSIQNLKEELPALETSKFRAYVDDRQEYIPVD